MRRFAGLLGLGHSERIEGRLRLAIYAIGANVFSKVSAFAVLIYSTRIVLSELGTERFGIWSTVSSVSILLSFFDLGISNALISRVAAARATSARDNVPELITDALVALALLALVVGATLYFLTALVPWGFWFRGASTASLNDARQAIFLFCVLFGASLLAQAAMKIYAGMQLAWIGNIGTAVGWFISACFVFAGPRVHGSMSYYLFATYGVQQLVGLVMLLGLWHQKLLVFRGLNLRKVFDGRNGELFRSGRLFFIMQLAVAVVWGSNQVILSKVVGPASAAEFTLLQRLFMAIQIGLSMLNAPLWALYADAHARSEARLIRQLLLRSMGGTATIAVAGCVVLTAAHAFLLRHVFSSALGVTNATAFLMAFWTILDTCGNAYAMYLNGVGVIRPQVITGIAFVIVGLPIKVAAAQWWGISGLLAAMSISYLLFTVVPLVTILRRECLAPLFVKPLATST